MGIGEFNAGVTLRRTSISSRGVEILQVALCYRNWDKHRHDGPLGSCADLTYAYYYFG